MNLTKQSRRKRVKSFTLLEITLCLALLSLTAGFIIWKVKGALQEVRFSNSFENLMVELQKAQFLALSYQSDLQLEFSHRNGRWFYSTSSDEPSLRKETKKDVELEPLTSLKFNDEKREKLLLKIYSSGRIEPLGVLKLRGPASTRRVDLRSPLLIRLLPPTYEKEETL